LLYALENIIDTSIRLVSQHPRQFRRSHPRRAPHQTSPAPLPIPPRIQASPVVPTPQRVQEPPRRQLIQPVRQTPQNTRTGHSSPDEIIFVLSTQGTPLHYHFPETIYVATCLPLRSAEELRLFKEHCYSKLIQANQRPIELSQELTRILDITHSPLSFQHFLWKSKVHINNFGMTETYSYIKRRLWQGTPNRAYLEPAYEVIHPWNKREWNTVVISELL
jgi:hypothetical protein